MSFVCVACKDTGMSSHDTICIPCLTNGRVSQAVCLAYLKSPIKLVPYGPDLYSPLENQRTMINTRPSWSATRKRKYVKLNQLVADLDIIVFVKPVIEDTEISSWWVWNTRCKRFRIVRGISKYDSEVLYFIPMQSRVIELDDKTRSYRTWDFIKPLQKNMRPVEYKTLEGAIQALEKFSQLPVEGRYDIVRDAIDKKIDKLPQTIVSTIAGEPRLGSAKEVLFGHPVTAVIRWMGDDGWDFDQAKTALTFKKCKVADSTIQAQLRAGKKGERGPPASLTPKEERELYDLIN